MEIPKPTDDARAAIIARLFVARCDAARALLGAELALKPHTAQRVSGPRIRRARQAVAKLELEIEA